MSSVTRTGLLGTMIMLGLVVSPLNAGASGASGQVVVASPSAAATPYYQMNLSDQTYGSPTWTSTPIGGDGAAPFSRPAVAVSPSGALLTAEYDGYDARMTFTTQASISTTPNWEYPSLESFQGAPSMAVNKHGDVAIATVTSAGTLQFWRQKSGTTTWTGPVQVAVGIKGSPSLVFDQKSQDALIAVVSKNGKNLNYYWQTVGSSSWHEEVAARTGTGITLTGQPAMGTSASGNVDIASVTSDGNTHYSWQNFGSSTWGNAIVDGLGTAHGATSLAVDPNGHVALAVDEGASGLLHFYTAPYGSSRFSGYRVFTQAEDDPAIAATPNGNVIASSHGKELDFFWAYDTSPGSWNREVIAAASVDNLAPGIASGPTCNCG